MIRLEDEIRERLIEEAKKYKVSEFVLFADELGWEDWMNDFTDAPEDKPISEKEISEIDDILKQVFDEAHKLL